jgi:hypothetical protein
MNEDTTGTTGTTSSTTASTNSYFTSLATSGNNRPTTTTVPNWTQVQPTTRTKHKITASTSMSTRPQIKIPKQSTIDVNNFHQVYGHVNQQYLHNNARHYGIKLTGSFDPCATCLLANIHKIPISKDNNKCATQPGERIFIDISQLTSPSLIGNKYCLLIVDDTTDFAWSLFLTQKSETTARILQFIKLMKQRKTPVHAICCDNSGENNFLKKTIQQQGLHIKFEFTAPGTPQQNGRVERKFSILYEYMCSMLNQAQLPDELRKSLWAEAAHQATDSINVMYTSTNHKPPYTKFYEKDATYFPHLRRFGEVTGVANMHKKLKAKTVDCVLIALYLGRAIDHSDDTF